MGLLQWALKYRSLGMSVIPVFPKGKEPLIPWKEFQQRKANESEIKEWWKKWPDANLGVVTGSISGVSIVDLDGPEGIKQSESLGLSSRLISLTGKGRHLWYKHPGQTVTNAVRAYEGVDVRGDGGFVLAPPSIHPNGKKYRWVNPVISVEHLPLFPMEVFATPVQPQTLDANEPGWIAKALEEMKDGTIDDTLFRVCSRLRHDGYTRDDARLFLESHATRVGATAGHLQDKIDNVWNRYETKRIEQSPQSTNGQLILHSPTNPDSIEQYRKCALDRGRDLQYSTGYPKFDAISKGLKKGEVLTVAARTGVGKTNWIIAPIRTFCEAGKKVLLFSTEMSFDQIWQRYTATLLRSKDFEQHHFYVCDEFTPNIERIEEAIRHVNPDLFVFDHISHIATDYHIISKFMSEIKRLARLFNIPAIVTAQLNRNADWVEAGARVEPRLSMIQGSDQIGQMSAQVLLLNEKRVNPDYTEIEGIIVKNRHGDKGMVQFGLKKNPYRIEEL